MNGELETALIRLASAMDRLAAAMERAHLDKLEAYNGGRRMVRVSQDEWGNLTARERAWAYTG